ncbi:histone acetyltransferase type B subunit 2 [Trichomonascus vanleenenianus]|uniref:WD repeat RBAP46/RBAP48/MSI1 family protein n=1 Tax=Trichomonascus vanleenenianus TaxID=2268995 RepID=UPI003ECB9C5F
MPSATATPVVESEQPTEGQKPNTIDAEFYKEELQINEKIINEEYKIWKKQAPFLYDVLLTRALDWPSLTLQWLPGKTSQKDQFDTYSLLLGTHTSGTDKDYLQVAQVDIPNKKYNASDSPSGLQKVDITTKIEHEGEVNKARFNPKKPEQVATMAVSGDVLIFNELSKDAKPALRLKHHTEEGYALAWQPTASTKLVSGTEDATVAVWDIANSEGGVVKPLSVLKDHRAPVHDVAFSAAMPDVFGSVSEDLSIKLFDLRDLSGGVVLDIERAHEASVNSISFNPFSSMILATGSSDNTVAIWDLRNTKTAVYSLQGHSNDVSQVKWSPHHESVLASASYDRRLNVWDLGLIGKEQAAEDEQEGPAELLFIHGGHTNRISDFDWHPDLPFTFATSSEDNVVQVWKIAGSIVSRD